MIDTMEYKGYIGSVEYSEPDGVYYGRVMGIRGLVSYDGKDREELSDDFHTAVEDYLVLMELTS